MIMSINLHISAYFFNLKTLKCKYIRKNGVKAKMLTYVTNIYELYTDLSIFLTIVFLYI